MLFTIDKIKQIAEELKKRGTCESKLILKDGSEITTDAGYACDGIDVLVRELTIISNEPIKC